MSGWLIMFFEWRTAFSNRLPKVGLLVSLTPCSLTETRKESTRNRHAFSTWFNCGRRLFLGSPAAIPGRSVMTQPPSISFYPCEFYTSSFSFTHQSSFILNCVWFFKYVLVQRSLPVFQSSTTCKTQSDNTNFRQCANCLLLKQNNFG